MLVLFAVGSSTAVECVTPECHCHYQPEIGRASLQLIKVEVRIRPVVLIVITEQQLKWLYNGLPLFLWTCICIDCQSHQHYSLLQCCVTSWSGTLHFMLLT